MNRSCKCERHILHNIRCLHPPLWVQSILLLEGQVKDMVRYIGAQRMGGIFLNATAGTTLGKVYDDPGYCFGQGTVVKSRAPFQGRAKRAHAKPVCDSIRLHDPSLIRTFRVKGERAKRATLLLKRAVRRMRSK
jgi:hypothetical protein